MTNLVAEYVATMRSTPLEAAQQLNRQFAIPWTSIAATCPVPTKVSFADSTRRLYHPDPGGMHVWVLPVTCVDPEQPEEIEATDPLEVVSCGRVIDLLAFDPERPRRFVQRTGLAAVLGAILPQYLNPDRVRVWRDVSDWLRAGCVGLVLLTDDPFQKGRILRRIADVKACGPEHAAELRTLIKLPAYPQTLSTRVYAMRRAT